MTTEKRKKIKLVVGTVEETVWLTEDTFCLIVAVPDWNENISPGQFFMIKGWEGSYPLLRRPFSLSDMKGGCLTFVIKRSGKGTNRIAERIKGDRLSLLGPLGNGFVVHRDAQRHIFVAGGVGIAPFPLLAKALKKYDRTADIELIYGERDVSRVIATDRMNLEDIRVSVTTEDGSAGRRGLVTDLLSRRLVREKEETAIYACGPDAMLKVVQSQLVDFPGPVQFSLESNMGCGMGSCMGCVSCVKKGGKISFSRVCRDGPVFDGKEVVF